MPSHSDPRAARRTARRGSAPRIERDPDVLGVVCRRRRALSRRVRGRRRRARVGSRSRRAGPVRAGGAANRRAVVADRRRDADGRDRARARRASNRILEHRRRLDPRRGRRDAGRSRRRARAMRAATIRRCRPSPGAFAGGIVATNAAGAATFKYGTTRDWVRALTVVLPSGDVLDIERGGPTARSPTGTSRSSCPTARSRVPRAALPDAATCRSCRPATSPRRAWTSSICSSDPKARSASSPR